MKNDAAGYAMEAMRPRFDALRTRHEDGTAPQAVSAHQLFQTPADLAAALVALLDRKSGARVLEPSAGLGRLLDALIPFAPAEVVAVENAPECAGVLFRLDRAGVSIRQADFLTLTPEELGLFDAVVMNPPFHMRADIRHIRHAMRFLKPGGQLAAVCMAGRAREEALRPLADVWQPVPAGAFGAEGTETATIMLRIRQQ
jgi:SAM-dependent methyltransferase